MVNLVRELPLKPHNKERIDTMSAILSFVIGAMFGACIGVTVMCVLQVGKLYEDNNKEDNNAKND